MKNTKVINRTKVRMRIRKIVKGTPEQPRLSVFKSNRDIYVQLINDLEGTTIVASSTKELGKEKLPKIEQSKKVGQMVAKKAIEAGVSKIVFDRGGYLYHGRVKALADGAREGGLQF
jgi:large subunit ribosomal protein L18